MSARVTMVHPDLTGAINVGEAAVAHHERAGWQRADLENSLPNESTKTLKTRPTARKSAGEPDVDQGDDVTHDGDGETADDETEGQE